MRGLFGLLGLLLTLAVVGLLAKRALAPVPLPVVPSADGRGVSAPAPRDLKAQQEQIRRAAEAALQAPRPQPDDR